LGVGKVVVGPMGDKVGRLRPLTRGLVVVVSAERGGAVAKEINQVRLARLFEGLAGAGGAVL